MNRYVFLIFVYLSLAIFSCRNSSIPQPTPPSTMDKDTCIQGEFGWTVSLEKIADGGVGKDGIPALTNPNFISPNEAHYLQDNDLVLGLKVGDEIRAYPHKILDHHEIVNENIGGTSLSITFCPLTGTGIVIQGHINGIPTDFGVSGFLYNSNLIIYDKLSETYWDQMLLQGIRGSHACEQLSIIPSIETTWGHWKKMYPNTKVLSTFTDYNRPYEQSPLSAILNNQSSLFYTVTPFDSRLPVYERVHGVIEGKHAKVYQLHLFDESFKLLKDDFDRSMVIVGNRELHFIRAFYTDLPDGSILNFELHDNPQNALLVDQEGNTWDIWGSAIEGPRKGQQLQSPISYNGYWFAFGAIYPNPEIYRENEDE